MSLRTARRVIRRFIAEHREPAASDPADNEVTLSPKRNGRWRLSGDLDAETAAVVNNELRRLADAYRDDENLGLARRAGLALLDMARRSVTLGQRGPGSRPELVIVADVRLNGDLDDPRHEDGTPLSRQAFETLSCDASIRRLIMNGPSEVLDLGRSQRIEPPASAGRRRSATAGVSTRAVTHLLTTATSTTSGTGPSMTARPTSPTSASSAGATTP